VVVEVEAHQLETLLEEQVVYLVLIHVLLDVEQNSKQLVVEAQIQLEALAVVLEKVEVQVLETLLLYLLLKGMRVEQVLDPEAAAVELAALDQIIILQVLIMVVKEALDLRGGQEIALTVQVVAEAEDKVVLQLLEWYLMPVHVEPEAKEEFKEERVIQLPLL
jgi:hypothetical protein